MRFLRIIIPIVAAAALIGTIGMFMYDRSKSVPPVITSVSGKNAAEVSCKVTDEELLKLVTAHDSKDGDLSDKITVQRNMFFTSPGCAGISALIPAIHRTSCTTDLSKPFVQTITARI